MEARGGFYFSNFAPRSTLHVEADRPEANADLGRNRDEARPSPVDVWPRGHL